LDANPAFIEMLGFESLLDARRTNISELWSQPEARDRLKDLLARNGVVRDFEVEWQRRDGRTLWTSLSLRAMCDIRGTIDYFEGVAVDITERRRAHLELQQHRQELERSNEDLEHFAYVASHDLREPLRMVGGFAELFAQRYKGKLDNTADEFISYMIDGVRRMDSLITMLLQYSRAGKDDNFGPVDMNSIMKRTLLNLGSVIEESSSQITCDTLPLVNGDETALGNVMLNLISNGIKFRGEQQPKIHISAEDAGDKWVISVADNGIGFEPQFNEAVFTMFRRLHTQAEYPGSGIGLAICKRIIERHGGHIWVESQPGKGSVFHLSFEKLLTPLRPNLAP
jgi:PAS domain S-box-containing protein